ncbi:hypothetical protein P4C99_15000 [Pontiellaceae bacterium B1224]|nr:hypothetical protein [Pontiellaceae bacterium B1224]
MYILLPDGTIDDFELDELKEFIPILDRNHATIYEKLEKIPAPEHNVYWSRLSYISGLGFTMAQQYISTTISSSDIDYKVAFELPPFDKSGISKISIINAGANYWKHYCDYSNEPLHKGTKAILDSIDFDISSYGIFVLLYKVAVVEINPFNKLCEILEEWRNNMVAKSGSRGGV